MIAPQNPSPLIIRDGKLLDFDVEASSPVYNDVERARRFAGLCTYKDQKANLERAYEKIGKDIFVGSFKLVQTTVGGYETFSKPEADRMVLRRANWKRVREVLGDFMLDTKMFPPRYYVSKFPTAEQFGAMFR